MDNPAVCSECGAAVRPDAVFCVACGHTIQPLGSTSPPPPPQPPSQPDPTRMYQAPPNWAAAPPPSNYPRPQAYAVKNYLVESIIATILCCVPFGVVAIIFAAQVDGHQRSGNMAAAVDASNKAKLFTILSVVLGLLGTCGWIGLMGISFNMSP